MRKLLLALTSLGFGIVLVGCGNGSSDEAPPKVEGSVPVQTATSAPPGPGSAAPATVPGGEAGDGK